MEKRQHCDEDMEILGMYARCKKCRLLFVNMNGIWQEYIVVSYMKSLIERALGFEPTKSGLEIETQ